MSNNKLYKLIDESLKDPIANIPLEHDIKHVEQLPIFPLTILTARRILKIMRRDGVRPPDKIFRTMFGSLKFKSINPDGDREIFTFKPNGSVHFIKTNPTRAVLEELTFTPIMRDFKNGVRYDGKTVERSLAS